MNGLITGARASPLPATRLGRRSLGTRLVGPLALCAALLAGCGDADDPPRTQPAPGVTTFEDGPFAELPQHPRSEPFGTRTEQGDIVSQSFRTTGVTPEQVLQFYADALEAQGWAPAEPVHRSDAGSRRDWVNEHHRLEVSATTLDDRQDPSSTEAVVQYSLVLRPRGD